MRNSTAYRHVILFVCLASLTGCGGSDSTKIDSLLGDFSSAPILTSIPDRTVQQDDLLSIDVNNIKEGVPGSDTNMTYTCTYDTSVDGRVEDGEACSGLANSTVEFGASTGILKWTPHSGVLGNYEVKITGRNDEGTYDEIFTVGVRLKFAGIGLYTSISGTTVTVNWTPNPSAQAYQIFKLNPVTGQYEIFKTVSSGSASGTTLTGLAPNSPYTLRVQALDPLGNLDGNVVSRSFTTTELVKLSMSAPVSSLAAGTPTTITVQAYNADGSLQTIGGLPVIPSITSGTSSGNFSSVIDHDDGTYSFTFTPTSVGTAIVLEVSINISFYLQSHVDLSVVPGPASSAASAISISSGSVISNNAVTLTATVRDAYNNPISSGQTVAFTKTGGTSTGNFSAINNQGNGVYSVTYTGITAGSAQTLGLSVNGVALTPTTSIQVLAGTPVSANSSLSISSSTLYSGNAATVTATLKDINNNPVPSGIMVVFNKSGGTSSGNFDAVTNAGSGVYTTTYTGVMAGTAQTLSIAVDGVTLTPTVSVSVQAGSPYLANSSLSLSSPTVVSGNFITATATLKDINNNPVDSGIVVSFSKTGGTSTGNFNAVTNAGNGVYNIRYTGITAGSAQTLTVLVGGTGLGLTATVSVLTGSPSSTQSSIATSNSSLLSGSTITITATIRDENSNPVSSGVTVAFSKTGGTATGNFDTVTNAGNGVYTVTYTGITAGTAQTIGILIDGFALGPTTSVSVTPGAPSSSLSTLSLSGITVIAGQDITLTATIKDANSNPISTGLLVDFDKIGGTSFGNLSLVTNQGNGVYTATYTGITAGTAQTLQANVNGAGFGPTQSIQVLVGAPSAANSTLSVSAATVASGTAVTITAVMKDSENNPITTQYAISFDAIGGSSTGTLSSVNNAGNGSFTATYTGVIAGSAQTVRVLADGTPISGMTESLQVVPGAAVAANSTFTIGAATVQSGTATSLSINLRDTNNNAISSGATISFTKSSGVSDGVIGTINNAGSGNYNANYTATTMGAQQTLNLVVNGTAIGLSVNVTVTAGPPTHFSVSQPANPLASIDCNGPYTLTLKDTSDNTTTSLSPLTLALSSAPANSHTGTIFSDAGCLSEVSAVSMPALTNSAQFYYKAYVPVSFVLTVTPGAGITPVDITITNAPVLSWIGASSYFTMNGTGSSMVMDDSSGGLQTPYDVVIKGDYLYAVDFASHRILKYNITTNAFVGWVGYISSTDGMTASDGGTGCNGLALNSLTPVWCKGGRASGTVSVSTVLNNPRGIAADDTYIYVSNSGNHRVSRFLQSDGSFQGWIGKIGSTKATNPQACFDAGTNATAPTWCDDGSSTSGSDDGQFNGPGGVAVHNGKLYVVSITSHRVMKIDTATGAFEGWVGNINTLPPTSGQLPTCPIVVAPASPVTVSGDRTPGWCLGGTAKSASRRKNEVTVTPAPEKAAPDEGFNSPNAIATDGVYLYVGDQTNYRVVRILISTGAFSGWIGNIYRSSAASPTSPAQTSGSYTSTWTMGGVTEPVATTKGFGSIAGLAIDTTSSPAYLYITDGYHRLIRVQASDGQDYRWIGRASTSPTGGFTGCSSTPIGGTNPGWCVNGGANKLGNTNGAFYSPNGIAISSSKIYVAEQNNFRIQRLDKTDGAFDGWIGGANAPATKWLRTTYSGAVASNGGIGDYSFGDIGANYFGMAMNSTSLLVTDPGWHRIKRYNRKDGSFVGYIGQIGTFAPVGPENCAGYTSGMTPDWCSGGGRTGKANGIHGYENPFSVAADSTYLYIANYTNDRIDRVRISDALYLGWIGRVLTTPTDGVPACLSKASPEPTPDWCIGGTAGPGTTNGKFDNPRALFYDSTQNLLYATDNSSRIMKINPTDGSFVGVIGGMTAGTGCAVTGNVAASWCTEATGSSASARYGSLSGASSLATNSTYIFAADTGNNRIVRFDKSTGEPKGFLSKLNTNANIDTTTSGGACENISSGYPRVTPGWCWTTTLGQSPTPIAGSEDGSFRSPRGVWADETYVYVTDTGNNRILRITANSGVFAGWKGLITSTTGMTDLDCVAAGVGGITPKWCYGGASGPGLQLGAFDYPTALFGDANYLYVHDGHNNRIVTIPKN